MTVGQTFPYVKVAGSAYAMGVQHGEQAAGHGCLGTWTSYAV